MFFGGKFLLGYGTPLCLRCGSVLPTKVPPLCLRCGPAALLALWSRFACEKGPGLPTPCPVPPVWAIPSLWWFITRAETPRQTVLPPWGCSVLLLGFLDKGVSQPSSWNSMLLLKFKGGVGQP